MQRNEDTLISAIGPLAAIPLGIALIPLRGYTSASNFTYLFILLTILVAEYGGPKGAVATALCSALSLDFFLTRPYLSLTIMDKHDIIAFAGLTLCGILVAALSSGRAKQATELESAREQLDLLYSTVVGLESAETIESRIGRLLDAARDACPLAAAAIRDEQNSILVAFDRKRASRPLPVQVLSPLTLLPRGTDLDKLAPNDLPLPQEGARVPLVAQGRQVGWFDLWGNGAPASAESRRTIAVFTALLTMLLTAGKDRPLRV